MGNSASPRWQLSSFSPASAQHTPFARRLKAGCKPRSAWCSFDACGYCQSGQIVQAATLLAKNKNPSRDEIVEQMNGNICRCGTYLKIISAILRAARKG
jgi:isoquinoline 1-oxidoreductase alpha subunit